MPFQCWLTQGSKHYAVQLLVNTSHLTKTIVLKIVNEDNLFTALKLFLNAVHDVGEHEALCRSIVG